MPIFKHYLFADYSGQEIDSKPPKDKKTKQDLIQLVEADKTGVLKTFSLSRNPPSYSRNSLRQAIELYLDTHDPKKERVIFGMDHQYGWPLCLRSASNFMSPWRDGIECLANPQTCSSLLPPLDIPRIFCAGFNQKANQKVFWSPTGAYGLPRKNLPVPFRDRIRLTELRCFGNSKVADEIGTPGAVGGQTICGLKQIAQLLDWDKERKRIAWWPFDGLDINGPGYKDKHVGVEIFPALYPISTSNVVEPNHSIHCRDALRSVEFVQQKDQQNLLAGLLDLSRATSQDATQIQLEGWIVGVTYSP